MSQSSNHCSKGGDPGNEAKQAVHILLEVTPSITTASAAWSAGSGKNHIQIIFHMYQGSIQMEYFSLLI